MQIPPFLFTIERLVTRVVELIMEKSGSLCTNI